MNPADADEIRLVPVQGVPWISIGGFSGPHLAVQYLKNGRPMLEIWGELVSIYVYNE